MSSVVQSILLKIRPHVLLQNQGTLWEILVERAQENGELWGVSCARFAKNTNAGGAESRLCLCGRFEDQHSYTSTPIHKNNDDLKWVKGFAGKMPLTVYGQLENGARYIRCSLTIPKLAVLTEMIKDNIGSEPKLIVSCYGGAKYFTMKDDLEKELMNGIGQIAATKDVWLLTTGLNSGVSKFVGQAVHRYKILNDSTWQPVLIGLSKWATIAESSRNLLKAQRQGYHKMISIGKKSISNDNDAKAIDEHHTHLLLLDDGCLDSANPNMDLDDKPRSDLVKVTCKERKSYAVTIIVEGGRYTPEVIQHDLKNKRPVIIVHGSGRLADVLGDLLLTAGPEEEINRTEIERQLRRCTRLWPKEENHQKALIRDLEKILTINNRRYLSVFQLGIDTDLTDKIFQAVISNSIDNETSSVTSHPSKEKRELLKLAVSWNCVNGAHDILKLDEDDRILHSILFEQALSENRPMFVDYFLRRYYNPLDTYSYLQYIEEMKRKSAFISSKDQSEKHNYFALQFLIEILYNKIPELPVDKWSPPKSVDDLDRMYSKIIGRFVESFYNKKTLTQRFYEDYLLGWSHIKNIICCLTRAAAESSTKDETMERTPTYSPIYTCVKTFENQEMLRDIFLWSVYVGHIDIALILLLQLKCRISAALIAACIAKRIALMTNHLYTQHKYEEQGGIYERYATDCIDICYKQDERRASKLLLREVPLFGNATCAQIAIRAEVVPFINTNCFNKALNIGWYGYLERGLFTSIWTTFKYMIHLCLLGILAPFDLWYRDDNRGRKSKDNEGATENDASKRNVDGIESQQNRDKTYFEKLYQFHASPIVMICYQFLVYIWFLLVFSYWMLVQMRPTDESIHWTEIYLIVAVSAALIDDIRVLVVEYSTQMLERWRKSSILTAIRYGIPYLLFYIGIIIHFNAAGQPELFTVARIILALDLEMWYFSSLHFVSAIRLLGPKLFMIRNMLRDLIGIIYIIGVCIIAYGVASRALVMHSNLHFTVNSLIANILYPPYWSLYGEVDDRAMLDDIISSNQSSTDEVTEAKAAHVLLAFHMLFVNILLLNLLIAIFNFSINDVQEKNKYFWRYQRYELICECFEKPIFTYPPLSLLIYIIVLIVDLIRYHHVRFRVFKILSTSKTDKQWTDFEASATYKYARGIVESKYRQTNKTDESHLNSFKIEVVSNENTKQAKTTNESINGNEINNRLIAMRAAFHQLQVQTQQIMNDLDSAINASLCTKASLVSRHDIATRRENQDL